MFQNSCTFLWSWAFYTLQPHTHSTWEVVVVTVKHVFVYYHNLTLTGGGGGASKQCSCLYTGGGDSETSLLVTFLILVQFSNLLKPYESPQCPLHSHDKIMSLFLFTSYLPLLFSMHVCTFVLLRYF